VKTVEPHRINRQLIELEAKNQQLLEMLRAQQMILGWLMARMCPQEARRFLADQATELEPSERYAEFVALFDELGEDVEQWTAQWSADQPARG
jgi:hypothetical protein